MKQAGCCPSHPDTAKINGFPNGAKTNTGALQGREHSCLTDNRIVKYQKESPLRGHDLKLKSVVVSELHIDTPLQNPFEFQRHQALPTNNWALDIFRWLVRESQPSLNIPGTMRLGWCRDTQSAHTRGVETRWQTCFMTLILHWNRQANTQRETEGHWTIYMDVYSI